MCQVLSLTPRQMEWVTEYLGHFVEVEKNAYYGISSALEKVQLAKILLMTDNGAIAKYSGQYLHHIALKGKSVFTLIHSTLKLNLSQQLSWAPSGHQEPRVY